MSWLLEGGGDQDPGDPGVGKVKGGRVFFLQAGGGGLTLDDTMHTLWHDACVLLSKGFTDNINKNCCRIMIWGRMISIFPKKKLIFGVKNLWTFINSGN